MLIHEKLLVSLAIRLLLVISCTIVITEVSRGSLCAATDRWTQIGLLIVRADID